MSFWYLHYHGFPGGRKGQRVHLGRRPDPQWSDCEQWPTQKGPERPFRPMVLFHRKRNESSAKWNYSQFKRSRPAPSSDTQPWPACSIFIVVGTERKLVKHSHAYKHQSVLTLRKPSQASQRPGGGRWGSRKSDFWGHNLSTHPTF